MRRALGRYLAPLAEVPLSRENVARVAGSLRASYAAGDTATLPAALTIDVVDTRHALALADFARVYDQARPARLTLAGAVEPLHNEDLPAMVAHATRAGSHVNVVTTGALLDARRAWALLGAGLTKVTVSIDADHERAFRSAEKLLAMRDANRKPAPSVEIQLVVTPDNVGQLCALVTLCQARFPDVAPVVVARAIPFGDARALAELRRARALADGLGLRRTAVTVDTALAQLTQDLAGAPCYVPWYAARIATNGEVYPCADHATRGTSVGNVHEAPFAEIWNGERMRVLRAGLRARRCDDAVCATCRHEDAAIHAAFGAIARMPGLGRTSTRSGGALPFGLG